MNPDEASPLERALLAAFGAGLVFGAGLALSAMTHPEKVLGFLDLSGHWDPSLLLVLGGATGIAGIAFPLILRRKTPLLMADFDLPSATRIDRRLIFGALLFGLGWGISGYCPGPAVALLAALPGSGREALLFLPALLIGSWIGRWSTRASKARSAVQRIDANLLDRGDL
ncbi:YeeE/YedE family protein [Rhodanobacter sp. A1T4]|uniref:YeeE/YedE family protein n=1 Tax=Rhodanobacter sp. A1T4 TaxID=2723087 RepID=UPI001611F5D9|nr:YeeE/YedE family protein [Rhodanobacter sp. A1T4]MBB6249410.1 hypothetical protein [Rhodanobacter sp. A1T4]